MPTGTVARRHLFEVLLKVMWDEAGEKVMRRATDATTQVREHCVCYECVCLKRNSKIGHSGMELS